jgi:hypothetical protein
VSVQPIYLRRADRCWACRLETGMTYPGEGTAAVSPGVQERTPGISGPQPETDQNRGRSTVRAPGDLAAPPGADLRVGGGVSLVGVAEHGLGVGVSEAAPDGFGAQRVFDRDPALATIPAGQRVASQPRA